MKQLAACIRREWWEHRPMLWKYPLFLSIILALITVGIASYLYFQAGTHSITTGTPHDEHALRFLFTLFIGPFTIFWCLSVYNYTLSCLHRDRVDNSIYFWQSIPVSTTKQTIAKLITALFILPAVIIGLICFNTLVLCICSSIYLNTFTDLVFSMGDVITRLLESFLGMIVNGFLSNLFLLPVFAWFMFCSVWSRRSPQLNAIFIPLGVYFVLMSIPPIRAIHSGLSLWFQAATGFWHESTLFSNNTAQLKTTLNNTLVQPIVNQFSHHSLALGIGLLVGICLMILTIYLRKNCRSL